MHSALTYRCYYNTVHLLVLKAGLLSCLNNLAESSPEKAFLHASVFSSFQVLICKVIQSTSASCNRPLF